jgi:hypothetical protein
MATIGRIVEALESYAAYQEGKNEVHYIHPDSPQKALRRWPDLQFVRRVRTGPLSLQDKGKWILMEKLGRASASPLARPQPKTGRRE